MSLSFVTKAIQTTAADGTFEEKAVESSDDSKHEFMRNGNGVGLFDQLRQNKEEEEATRLEFQRSIMRGTLALDEDDVAHLEQLQKQKQAELSALVQNTESEVASFRAAQAERLDRHSSAEENVTYTFVSPSITQQLGEPTKLSFAPTITIKNRKRRDDDIKHAPKEIQLDKKLKLSSIPLKKGTSHEVKGHEQCFNFPTETSLSILLTGYSSDENE
jgi:hypothetical protein